MKEAIIKDTKRNKCDYCDELAVYKIKAKVSDPYSYLCKSCYNDTKKVKKK